MKHIFRDVVLFVSITAMVFIFALACGTPFVVKAESPSVAQSSQAQSSIFQGTVLRNGERFSLRTSSGQIYQLDDPQNAQTFEGKSVRVTGKLDGAAKSIHVERIEAA
jgi:hypothetical protein